MSAAEYEQVAALAQNLSDLDKIRLIEAITAALKQNIAAQESDPQPTPRKERRGIWAGVNVSAEDIDQARREMWGNFPR